MLEALRTRRTKSEQRPRSESGTVDTTGLSFTGVIAAWSARYRWLVVAGSIAVLAAAMFVLSSVAIEELDYQGEGDSAVGADILDDRFDANSRPVEQLLFSNPSLDANDPAYQSVVDAVIADLRALPEVEEVASYYEIGDAGMVSDDGHVVLTQVFISPEGDAQENVRPIVDAVQAADGANSGFEIVIAGGNSIDNELEKIDEEDFGIMIPITMVLALTFMLLVFRSAVAAAIPLVLAVGSIFTAIGVATLVSHAYPMVDFLAQVVLLMGMAVGVDYSLFIVSRFRHERKAGRPKLEAIAVASNTTGRAVFYAGITVVLSLVGLMLSDTAIFVSMSVGVIIVVLIALAASLTLLPAMLAILGDGVNRLRLPIIGRESTNNDGGIWGAITDRVLAKPAVLAAVTTGALLVLAAPVFALNLGFASGSHALHDAVYGKRALQLLEENFTAGFAQPAFVVVDATDVHADDVQSSVASLVRTIESDDAYVPPFEVQPNRAGDALYVRIPVDGEVDGPEANEAVRRLKDDIVPTAFAGADAQAYVTGATAGSIDFRDKMTGSAPYVFGFVLGLAFLLLLVMFRSIIMPFKAIALNLLSVGAAYGVLVMVFQWGWGVSLLGVEATGMISTWLPLFLFSILFGLSMDYHMLLLNRIKESYDGGKSNDESVSEGIKITAGQITSAAAIMVGVFGTFALGRSIELKQMGLGLGVAVLIDATVIRSILLPASMKLLGDTNWYLPRWLEWLPKLGDPESENQEERPESVQIGQPATEALAVGGD